MFSLYERVMLGVGEHLSNHQQDGDSVAYLSQS